MENRNAQGGSGSAENGDRDRTDQIVKNTDASQNRQEIEDALGSDAKRLTSLQDMGAFSGRDDVAGGSGDGMEDQHSGQSTDR